MNVFVPRFATVALKLTCRVPLFAHRTGFFSCHESSRRLCSTVPRSKQEKVTIYFINTDGSKVAASAKVGDSLLDVVVDGNIDIDGFGACEGTLACSTCHLILKKKDYDKLPEQPTDEEQDMLDMAYGLEDTSRLGCQVYITKDMDGLEVKIPTFISDARG